MLYLTQLLCINLLSQSLPKLTVLDVSWNNLSHLHQDITVLKKHIPLLQSLDIRYNYWKTEVYLLVSVIILCIIYYRVLYILLECYVHFSTSMVVLSVNMTQHQLYDTLYHVISPSHHSCLIVGQMRKLYLLFFFLR